MELALIEQVTGGVIIRMNRPQKRNAVNDPVAAAVIAALDAAEADDSVRAIILTGSGDSFNAGQDFAEATGRVARDERFRGAGGSMGLSRRLARFEKPVIGAINGHCMGGGTITALYCDIRIASETATFRFPGAAYGLVVAASLLPAAIGQARAKDLIFTARTVDAREAYELGLINKIVPAQQLEPVCLEYLAMIAANSPAALRESKRTINLAVGQEGAIEYERQANERLRTLPDHGERFGRAADRIVGSRQ